MTAPKNERGYRLKTAIYIPSYSVIPDKTRLTALSQQSMKVGLEIAREERADWVIISTAREETYMTEGREKTRLANESAFDTKEMFIISKHPNCHQEVLKVIELAESMDAENLIIVAERKHSGRVFYTFQGLYPKVRLTLKTFKAEKLERGDEVSFIRSICSGNRLLWRLWNTWAWFIPTTTLRRL